MLQLIKNPHYGLLINIFQNRARLVRSPFLVSVFTRPDFVFANTQKYQDGQHRR